MKAGATLVILVLCLFFFYSCKKYDKCDNAQLCVQNIGTTVVHYSWGASYYSDSIMPGKSACISVGSVNTDPNHSETHTEDFESDHGNYFILVDQCSVTKQIK